MSSDEYFWFHVTNGKNGSPFFGQLTGFTRGDFRWTNTALHYENPATSKEHITEWTFYFSILFMPTKPCIIVNSAIYEHSNLLVCIQMNSAIQLRKHTCNLQTIGTFRLRSFAAATIPSAMTSHLIMPPKILTKMAWTWWGKRILSGCTLNHAYHIHLYMLQTMQWSF